MARRFVAEFLVPLVRGGTLEVGRPLSVRDVDVMMRGHRAGHGEPESDAAMILGEARRRRLLALVATPPTPALDEETWRLGGAVHDLLTLSHPRIALGPGASSRIRRIATEAAALARLGPPRSLASALARHSLVARLPEIMRDDHTVSFWLGRRTFVGRRPPARILALPRLRAVTVESVRRGWLRDVGVLASARPAFAALTEASPLGEALDPLRLDPPWSWGRALAILKFPTLCRLVAGRLLAVGVGRAGDALTESLYRFVSPLLDDNEPVQADPSSAAFALAFLAHLVWLEHLFGPASGSSAPSAPELALGSPRPRATPAEPATHSTATAGLFSPRVTALESGRELAVLLAAANQTDPDLIWPPDVGRGSDLGLAFARRLELMFDRHDARNRARWPAALEVARLASLSARGLRRADADKV